MLRPLSPLLRQAAWIIALAGLVVLALALHPGPRAQPGGPDADWAEGWDDAPGMADPGFRVIPLREAAHIAHQRFRGRLIAARLKPPTPQERARGTELVHELKLLTEARDVLRIRLDARTGAFLEVAGSGLTRARRMDGDRE